jgi:hypothetical protein
VRPVKPVSNSGSALQLAYMGMAGVADVDLPHPAAAIVPTVPPRELLLEDSKGAPADCWHCGCGVAWLHAANSACRGRPCHYERACGRDKSRWCLCGFALTCASDNCVNVHLHTLLPPPQPYELTFPCITWPHSHL